MTTCLCLVPGLRLCAFFYLQYTNIEMQRRVITDRENKFAFQFYTHFWFQEVQQKDRKEWEEDRLVEWKTKLKISEHWIKERTEKMTCMLNDDSDAAM
jgi:hypothetical protein